MACSLLPYAGMVILLKRYSTGWVAVSRDYFAAFGTDTIPTAFGPDADSFDVLKAIEALNPQADVWLE